MVANTGKIIATKSAGTGKKANHTRKGQLIVLPNGKDIVDVVAGKPSPKSDVNLFHETKNINEAFEFAQKIASGLKARIKDSATNTRVAKWL